MTSKGYSQLPSQQEAEEAAPPAYSATVAATPLAGDQQASQYPTPQYGTAKPPPYSAEYGATYQVWDEPPTNVTTTTTTYPGAMPQPTEDYITDDAESGGFTSVSSFSDKRIRQAFIRKVYLILMVQLMFTFGIVCLFVFCEPVNQFVVQQPAIYWSSYGVFIVSLIALSCCNEMRRKFPTNIIMLALFTLALSYMVGTISSFYTTKSVLLALGICAGVCLSVTIFSIQTKYDFTSCIGVTFVMLMSLFWFGFFCIFFYSEILQVVYAGIGALVFTVILAVDTQLVIGGKRYQISPEEYVFAALNLYIDIVYIFLYILALFGGKK
ncbi:protein lifeguard 2-like [Ptychodera flava]|uniref:protein lifeguard 2-like n=1 Tax=Ptychodera flava TaxID=63121 RepID=UPI003969FD1F